jgi:hypothetical protein
MQLSLSLFEYAILSFHALSPGIALPDPVLALTYIFLTLMRPSRLLFCLAFLPEDCETYFFKVVRQFSTTVKGTEALCAAGTPMRKRLPSAVTSSPIKPGGN